MRGYGWGYIADHGGIMLTDTAIRRAKPADRPYKMTDGGGLFLLVTPAGGRLWRYRYRWAGKERLLAIGPYPDVSLADARRARDRAKELLRDGTDPSTAKRLKRFEVVKQADETFERIAREWHAMNVPKWDDVHAGDVLRSLERDVFPYIGSVPIRQLTSLDVLDVLRRIENRGARETARRIRQRIGSVFTYAVATMRAESNPAEPLVEAMQPVRKGRFPAVTDLDHARQVLRDVDRTPGHPLTKLAIRLLALTAVRPGVIMTAPWLELPPGVELWEIPAERMKLRKHHKDNPAYDHLVPLSRQARETIEAARMLSGRGKYVFPNYRNPAYPMSENAMGYMLNRAGYYRRQVPHGWRATFSTIMNERFRSDDRVIERILAHQEEDEVEAAYNRAEYLDRRRELLQIWADMLMVDQMPIEELLKQPRHS